MKMLKELRESKNLTQRKLSELIGFSQTSISNWETDNLDFEKCMIELAKFFNVSVGYLLGVEDSEGIIKYEEDGISVSDKVLLHDFHEMPPDKQETLRDMIKLYSKKG